MGVIDDASGKRADEEIWRAIRKLQTMSPLDNSSVEGTTRFLGNESLKVVGSALVSGWLIVTGTLKIVGALVLEGATTMTGNLISSGTALFTGAFTSRGTTRFEGDTTQVGAFHVTGPTDVTGNLTARGTTRLEGDTTTVGASHIRGNQDVTGTLSIKGVTTLEKDLNVTTGGRIVAGNTSFNPNGSLQSTTQLSIVGFSGISLAGTTTIAGICTLASTPVATGAVNAYLTSAGIVQKVGSARRFKIDPVPLAVPHALLKVPVQEWIDLGNAERFAALYNAPRPFTLPEQMEYDSIDLSRVPGIIAEDVEAAGGSHFVTYNEDGVIEGVAYDRLALARTQILAEQVDELRAELAELRKRAA